MKRLAFFSSVILLLAAAASSASADGTGITVFAAASLREAFEAAAPAFTKKTGRPVTFNFGGSDTLATQIAQSAPADVFASANTVQMTKLAGAGLLAAPARTFARNRLVVIVPKANPAHIAGATDLARGGVRLVLAAPTVPAGAYARTAFAAMHIGEDVEQHVVSNETDVKAVATKVALDEADAGVVYATDITPAIADRVIAFAFPSGAVPDIVYPIAALKSAPSAEGAAAFVDFILHDGQTYLRARGFSAP